LHCCSLANENLSAAGERFSAKYPEIYSQPKPPPEFVATFEKVKRLQTDYASILEGLGKLIRQFKVTPEVEKAMSRFKRSIDRVSQIDKPPKR
jgi:hypothetical protein